METNAAGAERAAHPPVPDAPTTTTPVRQIRLWRWAAAAAVPLAGAAAGAALIWDGPRRVTSAASALHGLRWQFLPVLVMLAVLHYVLAAIALRGATGRPLPLREATMTQFCAAAANRVTPGGLGGLAVNSRYLVCRGMPAPRAVAAVAVLQAMGLPADLLLLLLLLGAGAAAGDGSDGGAVLGTLGARSSTIAERLPLIPLLVLAALVATAAAIWGRRALRSAAVAQAVTGMTDLLRRPRDLLLTILASAATTLVMSLALAVSVLAVPGAAGPGDLLTLLTAYLVGAAAGATLPAPGGAGSTEAALVVALGAVGVPIGSALQAVLLFRGVTYWAPVPVGLLAARRLRTRIPPAKPTPEPALHRP